MILNDNSTQQINTLVIQLKNRITNLSNELKSFNKEISNLDSKISDLEIKDSSQANDTAAMNTEIQNNAKAISDEASARANADSALQTAIDGKADTGHNHDDRYYTESEIDTKLNGKADKIHTHTKSQITDFPTSLKNPNALTVNGKTYDGSEAVDAGVQTVANGGTGVTTQADINKAFVGNLEVGNSDVTDGTEFVSSWASNNGFSEPEALNTPFRRQFSAVWNYIKGKISSVLGLTKDSYGGKASTAGNADRARNMYYQNLDLSALDKTKFYPLVCYSRYDFAEVAICSESGMSYMEYNQNRIHFDISTQGWSDLPPTLNIREYTCFENNEITIGCIGRGIHYGAWAIWLRGGLHYTCFSRNADLTLHTSDYTYGDETYTVGTNYYGGSNTNVKAWFTPQSTITEGAYSSRQITAAEIKANNRMIIPIGAPSSLEDGCIWIER